MLFGLFLYDWTLLIVIPAVLFTLWAQFRINSTFRKFSKQAAFSGMTAEEAARRLLNANGLYNIPINHIDGDLTDHYDPRNRSLNLSDSVYGSKSIAAIGVACHEAGHAIQHAENYVPHAIRMSLVPICNIGSMVAMPLFVVGAIIASFSYLSAYTNSYLLSDISLYLMLAGIACFSLVTLFQLVTLPVEFNASRRALEGIQQCGMLSDEELPGARKVLSAAAMTYVAALATSLLSLLRLIVIARDSR